MRGTLTPNKHIERGFAMLAKLYCDARLKPGSKPIPLYEFMPHEDEPELSLEDAMKNWK